MVRNLLRPVPYLALTLGLWAVGVQLNELLAAIGAWSTAALVLAHAVRTAGDVRQWGWRSWWPLLAFLLWAVVVPPLLGFLPTGTGLARLSDWLLLPVAMRAVSLATLGQKRQVMLAAAATMLASCTAAGLQHFGLWPPLEAFDTWRWTKLPFARVYEAIPDTEGRFMGGGLLFHRLRFANITSLVVVMLLAHALDSRGATEPDAPAPFERRLTLLIAAVGLGSVSSFPYARSATVALVAGMVAVVVLSLRNKLAAVGTGLALLASVAVYVFAVPSLHARFAAASTAAGSGERPELLKAGWAAVREHPLSGVGVGRYTPAAYAASDAPAQVREHQGKAHNQFVSLAAEAGLPAMALFIVLLGWVARRLWRGRPATLGSLGALTVFVVLCLTHDPLFHAEMSLATVLVLGAGLAQAGRFTADSLR